MEEDVSKFSFLYNFKQSTRDEIAEKSKKLEKMLTRNDKCDIYAMELTEEIMTLKVLTSEDKPEKLLEFVEHSQIFLLQFASY